jgi:hypothetical protein
MKKEQKSRDFYTIDAKLYEKFLNHIEANSLNKSKLIESLIEEYMEKNENVENIINIIS